MTDPPVKRCDFESLTTDDAPIEPLGGGPDPPVTKARRVVREIRKRSFPPRSSRPTRTSRRASGRTPLAVSRARPRDLSSTVAAHPNRAPRSPASTPRRPPRARWCRRARTTSPARARPRPPRITPRGRGGTTRRTPPPSGSRRGPRATPPRRAPRRTPRVSRRCAPRRERRSRGRRGPTPARTHRALRHVGCFFSSQGCARLTCVHQLDAPIKNSTTRIDQTHSFPDDPLPLVSPLLRAHSKTSASSA